MAITQYIQTCCTAHDHNSLANNNLSSTTIILIVRLYIPYQNKYSIFIKNYQVKTVVIIYFVSFSV